MTTPAHSMSLICPLLGCQTHAIQSHCTKCNLNLVMRAKQDEASLLQTCYAPGATVQSSESSPEPREPSPEPRECLHAETPGSSSAVPTTSRPMAPPVQHVAATEQSPSQGHLVHITQPAAARLPYQRAASGPAVPRTLSRFASNAAAQSKPAFAPSRDRYDVVAVQQSVSMLQQISSTPLHATQASSGPSQAVQPLSGYTMAVQPNMLGAYLATRIFLAVQPPPCGYTMAAQPNMLGVYLATRICLATIL